MVRNDLDDVVAAAQVGDCRLEFRFQLDGGDLWCVTRGPLATLAHPLLSADGVAQARLHAREGSAGKRQLARYAKWPKVRITGDLVVAFRARGDDLQFAWLYGEGYPFGGGSGGLPTAQRASPLERLRMWLSGRRGARVEYTRGIDEGEH